MKLKKQKKEVKDCCDKEVPKPEESDEGDDDDEEFDEEELEEESEGVEKEKEPKPEVPKAQEGDVTKQEVCDIIEGNLNRALQLLQVLRE